MAIVVHAHANFNKGRPYGAPRYSSSSTGFSRSRLTSLQIAHLAGAGGYDKGTDDAAAVYAEAIAADDPRTGHLYFDVSGITGIDQMEPERQERLVRPCARSDSSGCSTARTA